MLDDRFKTTPVTALSVLLDQGKLNQEVCARIVDWAIARHATELTTLLESALKDTLAQTPLPDEHFVDIAKRLISQKYTHAGVALYAESCGCSITEAREDLSEEFSLDLTTFSDLEDEAIEIIGQLEVPFTVSTSLAVQEWITTNKLLTDKSKTITTEIIISRIKALREVTKSGLKLAKDVLDAYLVRHGIKRV